MLAVILLVTVVLVEGLHPSIEDDLLNGVKRSPTHDYKVYDHDAEKDDKPDNNPQHFNIILPADPASHVIQSVDRKKHQVSVEVNGDTGFVDRSLVVKGFVGYDNEEVLRHSDYDKIQKFQLRNKSDDDFGTMEYQVKVIVLESDERVGSSDDKKEEQVGSTNVTDQVYDEGVEDQSNNREEEEVGTTHVRDQTDDEGVELPSNTEEEDEKVGKINFEDQTHDESTSEIDSTNLETNSDINDDTLSDLEPSKVDNIQNSYRGPFYLPETKGIGSVYSTDFVQNVSTNYNTESLNNTHMNVDSSTATTTRATVLQEDNENPLSSTTVSNTPLVKVHVFDEFPDRTNISDVGDFFITPKSSKRNKSKSQNDSPITRISKVGSPLVFGPPGLVKDEPKPFRRRVLIGVKKKIRPQNLEDSMSSSTTDGLSTDDSDDNDYDDNEEDSDEGADLQHAPQDKIINNSPIIPQVRQAATPPFYAPLGIPNPIPPILPEQPPTKIHQPVLHHIIHALISPPIPEEEEIPDIFLHRYSPNFVPYPHPLPLLY
ncbi:protein PFC0760c-like [Macrosteles quadrilineatus]|uniref:protein PFC0760c-like n=1 Tax=Macrosteles quadrilineatus TaxID=74068 RepID=UPI0023E15CAC|nr:protein PFC0760c-like [Macrosteles quadrilineatus]